MGVQLSRIQEARHCLYTAAETLLEQYAAVEDGAFDPEDDSPLNTAGRIQAYAGSAFGELVSVLELLAHVDEHEALLAPGEETDAQESEAGRLYDRQHFLGCLESLRAKQARVGLFS